MSHHSSEDIKEKHGVDAEKGAVKTDVRDVGTEPIEAGGMKRNLHSRHLQMIAIGGTIGTGLFLGSGGALAEGGPVGALLGYSIMGCIVYAVMVALGEMATLYPVAGAFTHYATRFVDPAMGFAVGWNYWYSYAITLPTEITAAGLVISFWDTKTNVAVWITIFLVVICSFNFLGVRYYGEAEFWFSLMKVTAIIGLILLGIIIDLGGVKGYDRIGFRYWKNPGPFTQFNGIPGATGRFVAFWSVFVQAAFSFLGTEIVALTAAEAENPRKNMPRAIKRVFYRILLFYVGGIFVIGWCVPSNDPRLLNNATNATASPFVIAINNAGIKVLPSIVNAVILISAFSAGNSDLYASSRTLYGLAVDNKAPAIFKYINKRGVPLWCLAITVSIALLAYLNVNTNGATVFNWFVNISSITGLITWWVILLSYIRFFHGAKYHGVNRDEFPYKAPFQPYLSYFGIFFITVITIFNGFAVFLSGKWNVDNFIVAYICLPIFAVFYVFWKIFARSKWVKIEDMDFETGRRTGEIEEARAAETYVAPTSWYMKVWDWAM